MMTAPVTTIPTEAQRLSGAAPAKIGYIVSGIGVLLSCIPDALIFLPDSSRNGLTSDLVLAWAGAIGKVVLLTGLIFLLIAANRRDQLSTYMITCAAIAAGAGFSFMLTSLVVPTTIAAFAALIVALRSREQRSRHRVAIIVTIVLCGVVGGIIAFTGLVGILMFGGGPAR